MDNRLFLWTAMFRRCCKVSSDSELPSAFNDVSLCPQYPRPAHTHDLHQLQHHHHYDPHQQQRQFHQPHPNPLSHGYVRPFTTAVPIPVGEESAAAENFDSLSFDARCSLNVLRRREPLGASGNKPDRTKSEEQLAQQQQQLQQQQQQQQQEQQLAGKGREEIVRPSVEVVIPNEIGE